MGVDVELRYLDHLLERMKGMEVLAREFVVIMIAGFCAAVRQQQNVVCRY